MQRWLASLIARDTEVSSEDECDEPTEMPTEDQKKALRDLQATYDHPIKSSYQALSTKILRNKDPISILRQRELGLINFRRYPNARHALLKRFSPKHSEVVAAMTRPTFCGQFSDDGQRFISACQDYCIRLYDTSSSKTFERLAEIVVEDVGWSILDTALSPDRTSVAYSTWSDCIYLVKMNEDQGRSTILPLYLQPDAHSFSIFSLQYSTDGSEIIGGSNDRCVYIYDLQQQRRILRVAAHQNDVNAVRFIDNSNSLLVSGSDDGLVLVWDRRALNESHPKPVGAFAGHTSGITFVHSRMDTRYLISNGKDQKIKLWDMRRFSDEPTIQKCRDRLNAINHVWDYRAGVQPQTLRQGHVSGDPSVMTYSGHSVGFTLIRCYFSPVFTTGQRYIVTGSSDGCVYIYDVLTGAIEHRLRVQNNLYGPGREKCVRDVAWHPFENYIVSTSWDNRRAHVRWTHQLDISGEPCLSPPIEREAPSVEAPPTLTSMDPSMLQRLLLQRLLGGVYNDESDDDVSIED